VTVYRLCERGELAHIRVSNAIRIRLEDLDQYVARRRGPDAG
jgi:excisionase family DNA binding protein